MEQCGHDLTEKRVRCQVEHDHVGCDKVFNQRHECSIGDVGIGCLQKWEYLPNLILEGIFGFLSRRDRLACTMVCTKWKDAMDSVMLWSHFTVYIDTDLSEPSTMLTLRYYHQYLRSLSLDWHQPNAPQRWLRERIQELTKRVCRLLIVMLDSKVQLEKVSLHRFYERYKMKKVTYYIAKFLKSQRRLKHADFSRALFDKQNFLRHFLSLENSFSLVKELNVVDSYFGHDLLPIDFAKAFVQMKSLHSLKVDYVTFSYELVDTLIETNNMTNLRYVEMHLYEDDNVEPLTEETWRRLMKVCPQMKVALFFNDISHISRLKNKLQVGIPLVTCSINCNRNLDEFFVSDFNSKDFILFIARHYSNTLEHFKLRLKDNQTIVDELLLELAMRCTKLESLEFFGIIQNIEILEVIFGKKLNDFKSFSIATQNVSSRNFQLMVKIYDQFKDLNCNLDLEMYNRSSENNVYIHG